MTCRRCCSTRPGRSRSATAWPRTFFPVGGHTEEELADAAQLASLADETPEGRSIVVLAKERFNIRERELGTDHVFIPFSATTRMSGVDFDGSTDPKGRRRVGQALGRRSRVARRPPISTRSSSGSRAPARRRSSSPTAPTSSASSS